MPWTWLKGLDSVPSPLPGAGLFYPGSLGARDACLVLSWRLGRVKPATHSEEESAMHSG